MFGKNGQSMCSGLYPDATSMRLFYAQPITITAQRDQCFVRGTQFPLMKFRIPAREEAQSNMAAIQAATQFNGMTCPVVHGPSAVNKMQIAPTQGYLATIAYKYYAVVVQRRDLAQTGRVVTYQRVGQDANENSDADPLEHEDRHAIEAEPGRRHQFNDQASRQDHQWHEQPGMAMPAQFLERNGEPNRHGRHLRHIQSARPRSRSLIEVLLRVFSSTCLTITAQYSECEPSAAGNWPETTTLPGGTEP